MAGPLAIDGGTPLRTQPFPRWPHFTEDVIEAATQPLREGKPNYWTGPRGMEFQRKFADFCCASMGSRSTAALARSTSRAVRWAWGPATR